MLSPKLNGRRIRQTDLLNTTKTNNFYNFLHLLNARNSTSSQLAEVAPSPTAEAQSYDYKLLETAKVPKGSSETLLKPTLVTAFCIY